MSETQASCAAPSLPAASGAGKSPADWVAGDLIVFTDGSTSPNGAWCWFQDQRVIVDETEPDNRLLLIGSVSAGPEAGPATGDIDLLWANIDTKQKGRFTLHRRLEQDDHDSPSLYMRPDGRYVAMYSRHHADRFTRWRVSSNPHDPTRWGNEQTLKNEAGTTYNNVHSLPGDDKGSGRTYNFTRAAGFDPNIQVSRNHGLSWANAGKLLTFGCDSDRPYVRYASDGRAIHFITTEGHPQDYENGVYHGYVRDGKLYDSSGALVNANLFDSAAVSATALTTVLAKDTPIGGTVMTRAWTIDLKIDRNGNPVGVLSARANGNRRDHRFLYARYDGLRWRVNPLAKAGGFLYDTQHDYTGLAAIDPHDPGVVYVSSDINPGTGYATDRYEIYRGATPDLGRSWQWTAITKHSTVDNIRPIVPRWNNQSTALLWMRGHYSHYTAWDTRIVGLILTPWPSLDSGRCAPSA